MRLAIGILAIVATGGPALADARLQDGAYEVTHRLELPHIEGAAASVATVCLEDAGRAHGFPVLSGNNPLAGCPVSNLRRDGDTVLFDIVCPGGNAARAQGVFDVGEKGFQGRIAMNMGGKNMTMTEVQRGKRIGDCAADPATR